MYGITIPLACSEAHLQIYFFLKINEIFGPTEKIFVPH